MNEMNVMNLYEKPINFKDDIKNFKSTSFYRGHVVVVDDITGETILEKDNLVLLRGRTFALEKMFDKVNDIKGFSKTDLANKKICLWKAGRGGCVSGEPFNLLSIEPHDTSLGEEIPFIAVKNNSSRPAGYYGEVPSAIKDNYNNEYTYYYAKTFDDMEWVTNTNEYGYSDEIALKITLKITEDDFKTILDYDENNNVMFKRNTFINEIALCIANPVKSNSVDRMDNLELATKLNFESEPYFSNLKVATIYYYIYA